MTSSSTDSKQAAEFRLVTILFADVVGSTALTGEVEAETARLILDRSMRTMGDVIASFGGTVARLMGDGLLAFFGAPIAHEDDPERAARAAIELHHVIEAYGQELSIPLQLRIGLNTGRVVMGDVGGEALSEYTAMGQPVNLAARLQASADPGTTLVGDTTFRLINHHFELDSLGLLDLKGFDTPIQAYQLLKIRERTEPGRGVPGLVSPLIGRSAEFEALSTLLEELQTGRGAIAALVGEPGIGKSRLLAEVKNIIQDRPLTWAEGHASSHTSDQPFGVIRSLLSDLLNLNPHDTPAIIDLKLERELTQLFDQRLGEIWPSIALLLGAPIPPAFADRLEGLEPNALNRSMTNTFCQLVEAIASRQTTVLAFDDLHWADPSSLDLLQSLLLVTESVPLLVVLLFRPDRDSRVWELKAFAERDFGHRYQEFVLRALTEGESNQLVTKLLSDQELPQDLLRLLREKSEGNPFFLEELIRALIEAGDLVLENDIWQVALLVENVRVPETLQEVIQARIDRLQASERTILQTAAVIGRRFGFKLLESITKQNGDLPTHLLSLQRADLIRERSRLPESVYDFKQAIVQEVTYQQLLTDQRQDLHQRVGASLEAMFADRLDEHAAEIAKHFTLAGDHARASSFHRKAGDEAFRLNANLEASGHYTQAIDSGRHAGIKIGDLSQIYLSLGRALELITEYDRAMTVYQDFQELAEKEGNGRLALQARLAQTTLQVTPTPLFDPEIGHQAALEALTLARELDDPAAQAKILWNLCLEGRFNTRDGEAIDYGEQSLAIAEEHGLQEQIGFTLTDLYWSYLMIKNIDVARSTIERAYGIWQELGNLPMMADCLSGSTFLYYLASDFNKAIEVSQSAWDLSEKIDNLWGKAYSQLYPGNVHLELGQIGQAITVMQKSIEFGRQSGFIVPRAVLPAVIALIHAEMGATNEALNLIAEAAPKRLAELTSPFIYQMEAEIHVLAGDTEQAQKSIVKIGSKPHLIGTLALLMPIEITQARFANAIGEHEQALTLLDGLTKITRKRGISVLLPHIHYIRALALRALGRPTEALEQTTQALELTSASGAVRGTWQMLSLRAQLEREAGQFEAADEDLEAARKIIRYTADHAGNEKLAASFLARTDVAAILAPS